MKKTYRGSCHCGKVHNEVDIDLEAGTGRCNCSICSKRRYWGANVKPEDFRLMCDEAQMSDYQFNTMSGHHRFCRTCGIHPYGEGIDPKGNRMAAINIRCLEGIDLDSVPVQHFDGRSL